MSPINILFGSLAGSLLFVCGFFLGSFLTKRIAEQSVPKLAHPKDDFSERSIDASKWPAKRSIDDIAASLKIATPPAKPQSSKFLMQPDRRPKVDRENDQAMGELIDEVAQRGDAEL